MSVFCNRYCKKIKLYYTVDKREVLEFMVEKMTLKLVQRLEQEQLISNDLSDYYEYAIITLIERFLTIGTIVFLALIYQELIPTILFLLVFFSLRKRTGGFHAKNFLSCYLMTVLTYIFIAKVAPLFLHNMIILYILLLLSILAIGIIGTVNHPNMDMDKEEIEESKKAARWLVFLNSIIIIFLILLGIDNLYIIYMSIGIILCSTLLSLAKLVKQEVNKV